MYVEYCVWFLSPHLNNDITNQVRVQKIATIGITSKMWKELHTSDSRKKTGLSNLKRRKQQKVKS